MLVSACERFPERGRSLSIVPKALDTKHCLTQYCTECDGARKMVLKCATTSGKCNVEHVWTRVRCFPCRWPSALHLQAEMFGVLEITGSLIAPKVPWKCRPFGIHPGKSWHPNSFFKLLCRSSMPMLSLVADVSNKRSPLEGLKVLVVGAGGAGRALAFGAQQKGAQVLVANRTDGEERHCGGIGRACQEALVSFLFEKE